LNGFLSALHRTNLRFSHRKGTSVNVFENTTSMVLAVAAHVLAVGLVLAL
jgi:hypothetical protein